MIEPMIPIDVQTYAVNKQGHLMITSQSADELDRTWTPIKKKEYDKLAAQHLSDMDSHNTLYQEAMTQAAADKAATQQAVASRLGISPDELAVLLGS